MMGDTDWRRWDVHNPTTNGLRYLYHYSIEQASNMITSNEWKKAIFVRDPMDRILSAYLDKAISNNSSYVIQQCCPTTHSCGSVVQSSFTLFLHVAHVCPDPHCKPQMHRMCYNLEVKRSKRCRDFKTRN
jgi:Sulfotransferase family